MNVFNKERRGQTDVLERSLRLGVNDGLEKGGCLKTGTLVRKCLEQHDR